MGLNGVKKKHKYEVYRITKNGGKHLIFSE